MTSSANHLRQSFLEYFGDRGHRIVHSSPLVPYDDPTLLFTNAGMNQFKDVFLGREGRDYSRATSVQKCMRVSGKHNDLDSVGPSLRHHTLFEMLGNFSFGDYFKRDAIPLAWELLVDQWQLPADRLYATVFEGDNQVPRDDESYQAWRQLLPPERIGELGAADNFWQMDDVGPCGRCSEIYYFRGPSLPCAEESAGGRCREFACDCDRYVEIWNNVFMEFDRRPGGTLAPLPAPSVDTGMGLERVTAVVQGHVSTYDTDLFMPLLKAIGERTGTTHQGTMEPRDVSMRVVADHVRAMTFLIADGVVPSNEWRGYVLRKIMRRAMRHGKHLGMTEPFLHTLVSPLVNGFGGAYPELPAGRDAIVQIVHSEEQRFDAVLAGGLSRLEDILDKAEAAGAAVPGGEAFRLYDTYGLPLDFIEDMVENRRLSLHRAGFDDAMQAQRNKAREKSGFKSGGDDVSWVSRDGVAEKLAAVGEQVFRGYDHDSVETQVLAVFGDDHAQRDTLSAGERGMVVLADTPFYLEAGGQVSDVGTIVGPAGQAQVTDVVRAATWPRLHAVDVKTGSISQRDLVSAAIDTARRDATRRNHTATHLLHAALRAVLGTHVKQAGSLVAPDRLRFDFVHFAAVTGEQLLRLEQMVNEQILRNLPVQTEVRKTQDAIAAGAMALFGEKYGETVRVVSVPDFSIELCGGTHTRATGDIGLFAIVSESGVAAGVRRIEATTGLHSLTALQTSRQELMRLTTSLGCRPEDAAGRIAVLQDEHKRLTRELQQARMKAALSGGDAEGSPEVHTVAGISLMAREVSGLDRDGLRALVDQHRSRLKSGVVVLAAPVDEKVTVVVGVTPDLTQRISAGQLVRRLAPLVGGGGGGRPDFAEAGGKDPSKIGEMLSASKSIVQQMLEGR